MIQIRNTRIRREEITHHEITLRNEAEEYCWLLKKIIHDFRLIVIVPSLALPACAETAHVAQALTNTVAPETAAPEAIGSGKINSNHTWPTEGQNALLRSPTNPDSNITSAASLGGSDSDSEYVELTGKLPTSLAITPNLAGHTRNWKQYARYC